MAVKIIGLYFLISWLILIYCILEAPIHDKYGNKIEDSKLEKWKTLWEKKNQKK